MVAFHIARLGERQVALPLVVAFAVFCLEAVALQYLSGALSSEYGGAADEAAHYVTALMVRDFLLSGAYGDPMGFATNYYLHFPKVALGQWPPMQYGLLGLWFVAFGASRAASMAFIAVVASATATTLYLVGRRTIGPVAAWAAGAIFIALPLVQTSSGLVMLEHLVMFLTLLATLAFARFLSSERTADGLVFGLAAAAAILTRGSALSLALLPPFALLLSRRLDMLRSPALWLSALPVVVLCLPWYVATLGISSGSFVGNGLDPAFIAKAAPSFGRTVVAALGLVLGIPFVIGLWIKVVRPLTRPDAAVEPLWPTLAAMAIVTILFHSLVPASISARYMVPIMPVAVLFAMAGFDAVTRWLMRAGTRWPLRSVAYGLLLLGFMVETFRIPDLANGGYGASLAAADGDRERTTVVMIASGTLGEGSVVAAAAEAKDARFLILRGSKILAEEDWLGRNTKNRFPTTSETLELLERVQVDFVILDASVPENERRHYHGVLRRALLSEASQWQSIGSCSVRRHGLVDQNALEVYAARWGLGAARRERGIDTSLIQSLIGR